MVTGLGSGFFISPDGYAVTNNHVVDHAKSVEVTTEDGTIYTAKVIGTDQKTDLALIKVEGKNDFPYVNFETATPRVGDWVVAVGNPYGLGGTVTAGIISAEGREISANPYDDYIQIDAPINKGNSGGPTFDTNGNVIGVNTAIYSPSGGSVGIGFDIPASTVKMIVAQLKDKGVVTRSWLGVQVQPVTAGIAESLGMKKAQGALVDEATARYAGSPGRNPGRRRDHGRQRNNRQGFARARSRDLGDGSRQLRQGRHPAKGRAEDDHGDAGENAGPAEEAGEGQEPSDNATRGVPHLGLSVAPASEVAGAGNKGVVVTAIDPDGPAAEHGVQSGDVILDVGGKSVANINDLRQALSKPRPTANTTC